MTERVNNWGRWGADDQRGALNLLDSNKTLAALQLPRTGRVFSIAHPVSREAPVTATRHPVWHTTAIVHNAKSGRGSADDVVTLHSHSGTHLDALCHYWGEDLLYNSVPRSTVTSRGASRLSISNVSSIITRAVFLDFKQLCPVGKEGFGFEITPAHIETELARIGLELQPGDALLMRTGWIDTFRSDPATYNWGEPGISLAAAEWLCQRDVLLVGADNWGVEAVPPSVAREGLIVHRTFLNRFGAYILENLDLDGLVEAAGPGAYLLVIAPLRIQGGVGSPVNPLVII